MCIFSMEKFEEGKLAEGGAELNVEINGPEEKKLSASIIKGRLCMKVLNVCYVAALSKT